MAQDVVELLDGILSEDPSNWGKLSGEVPYRRLLLLTLREILLELRRSNRGRTAGEPPSDRASV